MAGDEENCAVEVRDEVEKEVEAAGDEVATKEAVLHRSSLPVVIRLIDLDWKCLQSGEDWHCAPPIVQEILDRQIYTQTYLDQPFFLSQWTVVDKLMLSVCCAQQQSSQNWWSCRCL